MKILTRNRKILCCVLLLFIAFSALFLFFKFKYSKPTLTIGVYTDSSWEVPNGDADRVTKIAIKKFKKNILMFKLNMKPGFVKTIIVTG